MLYFTFRSPNEDTFDFLYGSACSKCDSPLSFCEDGLCGKFYVHWCTFFLHSIPSLSLLVLCLSVSMSLFLSVTINLVRINATNPFFQITEEMSSYSVSVIGVGVYGNVQVNLVSDRKGVSVVTLIQFDLLDLSKSSKPRKTITVESCRHLVLLLAVTVRSYCCEVWIISTVEQKSQMVK